MQVARGCFYRDISVGVGDVLLLQGASYAACRVEVCAVVAGEARIVCAGLRKVKAATPSWTRFRLSVWVSHGTLARLLIAVHPLGREGGGEGGCGRWAMGSATAAARHVRT